MPGSEPNPRRASTLTASSFHRRHLQKSEGDHDQGEPT